MSSGVVLIEEQRGVAASSGKVGGAALTRRSGGVDKKNGQGDGGFRQELSLGDFYAHARQEGAAHDCQWEHDTQQ
jgi:hypothetical protein